MHSYRTSVLTLFIVLCIILNSCGNTDTDTGSDKRIIKPKMYFSTDSECNLDLSGPEVIISVDILDINAKPILDGNERFNGNDIKNNSNCQYLDLSNVPTKGAFWYKCYSNIPLWQI